jgi:hypothetical protein
MFSFGSAIVVDVEGGREGGRESKSSSFGRRGSGRSTLVKDDLKPYNQS